MPDSAVFPTVFIGDTPEADVDVLEEELVETARKAIADDPAIGALVLECTNFVPFSEAIRKATGLPVYDLYTLVMQSYLATTGRSFRDTPWN